ncbi:hypothetical protein BH11VER1_BH11VER1_20850 [soil metagenome]
MVFPDPEGISAISPGSSAAATREWFMHPGRDASNGHTNPRDDSCWKHGAPIANLPLDARFQLLDKPTHQ